MSAHHLEHGPGGDGSTADIIILAERMSVRIISRAGDEVRRADIIITRNTNTTPSSEVELPIIWFTDYSVQHSLLNRTLKPQAGNAIRSNSSSRHCATHHHQQFPQVGESDVNSKSHHYWYTPFFVFPRCKYDTPPSTMALIY